MEPTTIIIFVRKIASALSHSFWAHVPSFSWSWGACEEIWIKVAYVKSSKQIRVHVHGKLSHVCFYKPYVSLKIAFKMAHGCFPVIICFPDPSRNGCEKLCTIFICLASLITLQNYVLILKKPNSLFSWLHCCPTVAVPFRFGSSASWLFIFIFG